MCSMAWSNVLRQKQDHQQVRGARFGDKSVVVGALQLPGDELFVLHVGAVGGLELNVDFWLGEVPGANWAGGTNRGIETAMILGPRSDCVAAVGGNGMKIRFADLLLALFWSHGSRPPVRTP